MARNWGAVLQSAVNGYARGMQIRESADDGEFRKGQQERLVKEQAGADALKADLAKAAQGVQVQEVPGAEQLPSFADNRDAGSAEMQALPNAGLVQQPASYQVGAQTYADRAAADAAAVTQNEPQAVAARVGAVYAKHGQVDKSMALRVQDLDMQRKQMELTRTAQDMKKAGVMDAFDSLRSSGSVDSAKAALKGAGLPFVDDESFKVAPLERDLPGIGKVNTFQVTFNEKAADGTLTPRAINTHDAMMTMLPYKEALRIQGDGQERVQRQANVDRSFNQSERQFAVSSGRAAAADARAAESHKQQMEKGGIALDEARSNARIPAAVKYQVDGLRKEADLINAAIVKAQAEGGWDPGSPSGRELMQRRATLSEQLSKALAPFTGEAGAGGDPFGLRGKR